MPNAPCPKLVTKIDISPHQPERTASIPSKNPSLICVYLRLSAFICGKNLTLDRNRQFFP
ncbi:MULTISPECIES: hypothetical protein [Aerosakkonema]|uniref:hypothetical protein n=1 Tax=Aerosakkonema TaxID=1246629 RepID=UPI0035BC7FD2